MKTPAVHTNIGFIIYDSDGNICYAGKGNISGGELKVDSGKNILRKGIDGKEPAKVVYQDRREAKVALVDEVHYVKGSLNFMVPIKSGVKLLFKELE
jgi:hypothetical protein